MENTEKPFNCIDCDYHTTKPSDWVKHVNSKKHERFGKKKKTNAINVIMRDLIIGILNYIY